MNRAQCVPIAATYRLARRHGGRTPLCVPACSPPTRPGPLLSGNPRRPWPSLPPSPLSSRAPGISESLPALACYAMRGHRGMRPSDLAGPICPFAPRLALSGRLLARPAPCCACHVPCLSRLPATARLAAPGPPESDASAHHAWMDELNHPFTSGGPENGRQ